MILYIRATAENELSAIERDLDARGKLLDCELQEDMTRLDDIQAEKVRLMQQLQEHLNRVDEHNQLDKESVMSPLGAPESGHVLKCENEVVAKHYDMPAAVPLNGFSGMVSPTTAGVCFDYFAGVLQTASTCTASPVQPVVHVSTSGTSNGSSFSSNVIAKAFSSSNSERAPQSMSKLSSPLKRVKNEPARLMNTELDVGRCLQMYSFR